MSAEVLSLQSQTHTCPTLTNENQAFMPTQREKITESIPKDIILAFVVFAICCVVSFMVEPTIIDSIFTSNP